MEMATIDFVISVLNNTIHTIFQGILTNINDIMNDINDIMKDINDKKSQHKIPQYFERKCHVLCYEWHCR